MTKLEADTARRAREALENSGTKRRPFTAATTREMSEQLEHIRLAVELGKFVKDVASGSGGPSKDKVDKKAALDKALELEMGQAAVVEPKKDHAFTVPCPH